MKILMALDYYLPHVSGLSLTVERLALGLSDRGHAVTVLTHQHRKDLPREEREGPVRVVRAPVLARIGKGLISPAILSAAWRELRAADIFHLHLPLAPAFPLAFLAQMARVPLIVNYHCDLKLPPGPVNRFLEAVARVSQGYALNRAGAILNSTEDYARNTAPLARRLDRFVGVFPPVPDPLPSGTTVQELRERWRIRAGPVLLFVGRFAAEKGLPDLIAALPEIRKRFPEALLLLAGENREVPGETMGRSLAPLLNDTGSGLVATGFVPDKDMTSLFALADVLVLPSTNSTESFGMIQVEAMLCGLPVVASDLPGVRQPVLATGMGEISPISDPAGLAKQIVRVLESPGAYRRDREQIRQVFDLEKTFSAYERAYRTAMERGG
jgi:glycosyltransferase involved in cell wall biosynthesis